MRFLFFFLCCFRTAFSFPFDLDQVKEHIDRRFDLAKIELDPFPHLVIQNILPDEVYAYLLTQWPEENSFDRNDRTRRRIPVPNGCLERRNLPSEQKRTWQIFGEMIVNDYIKKKVTEFFWPCLNYKFSFLPTENLEWIKKNIQFMNFRSDGLNLDKYGYKIAPHVDQSYIFAAILIYFPDNNQHANYGTVLYKSLVGRSSVDVVFPSNSEFVPVKKIPFLPNTMAAFMQNPVGWHGVERINEIDGVRKAYHAAICLTPEFTEAVYGAEHYTAKILYYSDERSLDPANFKNF